MADVQARLRRTGYTESGAPEVANVVWEEAVPGAGKFWSSPSIARGRLYIRNNNGRVYCIDAAGGKQVWRFSTGVSPLVFSNPTIVGGQVFVAGYEMVYALPCHDSNNDGVISDDEVFWSCLLGRAPGT